VLYFDGGSKITKYFALSLRLLGDNGNLSKEPAALMEENNREERNRIFETEIVKRKPVLKITPGKTGS